MTGKKQYNKISDEEYFVSDKNRSGRGCLLRMLEKGIKHSCSICGIPPRWNNKPLSLQVDHIDGNRFNSVFENLRLLCPNCHAQTETFGKPKDSISGGKARYGYCKCGAKILLTSKHCIPCANKITGLIEMKSGARTTINYPSIEEVTNLLQSLGSWTAVSEALGISHNAIKKYFLYRGINVTSIPYKRKVRYNK